MNRYLIYVAVAFAIVAFAIWHPAGQYLAAVLILNPWLILVPLAAKGLFDLARGR